MPNGQHFKQGVAFDPRRHLVIHGSQLGQVAAVYPEIAQIAGQQPGWEGKQFIIFPATWGHGKLLKTLATLQPGTGHTKNHAHPIKQGEKLVAVVIHQTGAYANYDPLYTWRLDA